MKLLTLTVAVIGAAIIFENRPKWGAGLLIILVLGMLLQAKRKGQI